MKVLHISTFDTGGAGRAAIRLHKALINEGVQSKFLCLKKQTATPNVFEYKSQPISVVKKVLRKVNLYSTREEKNKLLLADYAENINEFTFPFTDINLSNHPLVIESDIINLHWVSWFVDYKSFFNNVRKPIVWTLHDMNPFQGGFHYLNEKLIHNLDLEKYLEDLKYDILKSYQPLHIIPLNLWMKGRSTRSRVFAGRPHTIIYNGIDDEIFKPYDKQTVRRELNLPIDKTIILFISEFFGIKRKGFDLLTEIISNKNIENVIYCAIGDKQSENIDNCIYLGVINDDTLLAKVYSAVDAFILPSREDNLPNVVLESLSCGTPVIATPVGAIPEIIENGNNGYVSVDISVNGLLTALQMFIATKSYFRSENIRYNAIKIFSLRNQALKYIQIYNSILNID